MSASALLSVPAPVASPATSSAPQGTAGADATLFKGLLSDALEDRPSEDGKTASARPRKDDSDDGAPQGLLTSPATSAPPVVQIPVRTGDASASGPPTDDASAGDHPASAPPTGLPAGAAGAPRTAAGAVADPPVGDKDQALAPASPKVAPTDGGMAAAAGKTGGRPPVSPLEPVADQQLIGNSNGPDSEPAKAAGAKAAAAAVAEAAAPVAPPASAKGPAPQTLPPALQTPLRPLAERTARPAGDDRGHGIVDAALSQPTRGVTAEPAASSGPPGQTASDAPVPRLEAAPLVVREPTSDDAPGTEAAPGGTTAPEPAPAAPRPVLHETGLSSLSRTTIDATAQIAAQIVRRLEGRTTRFEMSLTPEDLGRVDVKLDIDADGRLAARLAFDNPLAATDLKSQADALRRQLQDAGFTLADNALDFTGRDSSSSAFDRGGDARDGQARAFAAASRRNAEIDVAQPPRWMALSLSPTGVDLKV